MAKKPLLSVAPKSEFTAPVPIPTLACAPCGKTQP